MKIQSYKCPECNAPIKLDSNKCDYCNTEFIITSLAYLVNFDREKTNKYISFYKEQLEKKPNDGIIYFALSICYLDLGLADLAKKMLTKSIEFNPESSEIYFYYAVSLIEGNKIKTLTFNRINEIEKYLSAAIKLNPEKSIYYYFYALLKHEFHLKNGFRIQPTIEFLLDKANSLTYEKKETEQLLKRLNIDDERIKKKIIR